MIAVHAAQARVDADVPRRDDHARVDASAKNAHRSRRHGGSGFADREQAHGSWRKRFIFQRARNEVTRLDPGDGGADDGREVGLQRRVGNSQCVCLGSDQAERPVTTSNFLRRELTTWSASAEEQRSSSCPMIRVRAASTSVMASSE